MSWDYDDYEYESAAARKARIAKDLAKRVKRGEVFTAFEAPTGTKIVKNFWGLAWCRHLENYCGYENRLPRGRTYLRQGNVYNLKVEKGHITAEVTGSDIYEIEITIQPLPEARWQSIRSQCEGQVASLLDLLGGKLGDGVMKIVSDPDTGLFPSRREIKHFCTCPDSADLCKHRAAVLYAVGVLFDRDPKFLFELRGTDPSQLIANSAAALTASPSSGGDDTGTLADDDLSALFGIDLGEPDVLPPLPLAPLPSPVSAPAVPPAPSASRRSKKSPATTTAAAPVKRSPSSKQPSSPAPPKKAAKKTTATKSPAKKTPAKVPSSTRRTPPSPPPRS
jgi:uncharacterized Zn finger protein